MYRGWLAAPGACVTVMAGGWISLLVTKLSTSAVVPAAALLAAALLGDG
jgi:hypothetical protein